MHAWTGGRLNAEAGGVLHSRAGPLLQLPGPPSPAFHARHPGEWEICVYFLVSGSKLEYDVKWSMKKKGLPAAVVEALNAAVHANRADLLREWQAKVVAGR
jgi:hypothetical protein